MSSESLTSPIAIAAINVAGSPRSRGLRIDTSLSAGHVGGSIAEAARDKARRQELSENRKRLVIQEQHRVAAEQQQAITAASTAALNMSSAGPVRGLGFDDAGHHHIDDASQQHQQMMYAQHAGEHSSYTMAGSSHDSSGDLYSDNAADNDDQHHMMMLQQQQQQGGNMDHGDMVEDDEEGEEEDEEDDDDELSSSPSIPDDNIDFDLVYALHTFLATVEGQASVVKGDQLTLLDDSNSYWWLVRVLKTQAVGYIPAENIETPYERLARLNKHRNVDLAFATQDDLLTGTGSSLAQTKFANPHHPLNKAVKQGASRVPPQLNPELAGGGRFVDFAPPTYHEHDGIYYGSGTEDEEGGFDDDDEDEAEGDHSQMEGVEYDEEDEDEPIRDQHTHQQSAQNVQNVEALAGDEDSDGSFEGATPHPLDAHAQLHASQVQSGPANLPYNTLHDLAAAASQASAQPASAPINRNAQAKAQAALGVGRPAHLQSPQVLQEGFAVQPASHSQHQAPNQPSLVRKPSIDEQLRAEHEATLRHSPHRQSSLQAGAPANTHQKSPQRQTSLADMRPQQQAQQGGIPSVLQPRSASAASQNSLTQVMASPGSNQSLRLKPFPAEETEIVAASFDGFTSSRAGEPRKISLTPRIAREGSIESGLSDRALSPTPSNASSTNRMHGLGFGDIGSAQSQQQPQQYAQGRAPARSASGSSGGHSDLNAFTASTNSQPAGSSHGDVASSAPQPRRASASSAASAGSLSQHTGEKRAASPYGSDSDTSKSGSSKDKDSKKKKSSGILGGLFSRNSKKEKEKEKEKEKDKDKDSPKESKPVKRSDSKRGSPASNGDAGRSTSPHGMSRAADREVQSAYAAAPGGLVTQQLQARRAMEDMFGNDATRRQQQIEAQNAMYQQYGIHPRAQGERTNTQTFNDARAGPAGSASSLQAMATPPMHQSPQLHLLQTPDMMQQGRTPSGGTSPIATSSISSAVSSTGIGSTSFSGRSMRPGSLIGSPHVTTALSGHEVPTLNVLRIFAGDNIDAEATFKTVLLNESTSAEELVKQAMQRFHLTPSSTGADGSLVSAIMSEYYLVAKESSGDETVIQVDQKPLRVFEQLVNLSNAAQNRYMMPSVKRSSVGSIDSVASNLSMHPAIEKLRMNDFFDDSSVKLFINKRTPTPSVKKSGPRTTSLAGHAERSGRDDQHGKNLKQRSSDNIEASAVAAAPLVRFAVQIHIYQDDLPDSMAFDPLSPVLIPRSSLADRQQAAMSRSSSMSTIAKDHREKTIFFPRNASVLEVLETALDRFGIVEGVVDGGDAVEDKLTQRRSMGRTRYCLTACISGQGHSDDNPVLNASSKLLEAYSTQPLFKGYDRTSKEFRRRSMDAPYNTPTAADIQSSDPIFVIRKANNRLSTDTLKAAVVDKPLNTSASKPALATSQSSTSVYSTPMSEIVPEVQAGPMPQATLLRGNSTGTRYTARANTESGVDVALPDKSLIRSSRDLTSGNTRYSYIASDGQVQDISEIINQEWRDGPAHRDYDEPIRNSPSVLSHATADSFTSALESPSTPMMSGMSLSKGAASLHQSSARGSSDHLSSIPLDLGTSRDFLSDVLSRNGSSPSIGSSSSDVNERLDRVLAKVKAHGPNNGGIASALRKQQSQGSRPGGDSDTDTQRAGSSSNTDRTASSSSTGRSTPTAISSRKDSGQAPNRSRSGSSSSVPRGSPTLQSMRSTPQLEAPPSSASSTPKQPASRGGHVKQPSVASVASDASSSQSTSSPATASGNTVSTSMSSARATSSLGTSNGRLPIMYNDDDGIDYLLTIADMAARPPLPRAPQPLSVLDALGDIQFPVLPPELASIYDKPRKRIEALEARLDRLLDQVIGQ